MPSCLRASYSLWSCKQDSVYHATTSSSLLRHCRLLPHTTMSDSSRISQKAQHLARIRDNQRRSRARRKEYLHELEAKLRSYGQIGIEASSEIQIAARTVLEENRKLKAILRERGVSEPEVAAALERTPDQHSTQLYAAPRLSAMLEGRIKTDPASSTTPCIASQTRTLMPRPTPSAPSTNTLPPRSTDLSCDDSPSPGSVASNMSTPPPSSHSATFRPAPMTPPGVEIKLEDVSYDYPYEPPYNTSWTHQGDYGYLSDPFTYYTRPSYVDHTKLAGVTQPDTGTELENGMGYRYPAQCCCTHSATMFNMMNGYSQHSTAM
ncbi:hypothetical protein ACJQWK_08830 [Exserohilum turcicum]|uniref:BZIP domain-containing protein n=1 Tax=Exserohilum turcicum (strain 28A) TaxID=671987 RepID=R0KHY8_EXST2|nr:uncharacterized protein SETTUDRAFT_169047 [Exserohilum turcica Et28A]EOA87627.1 hypothetical protein SETTUDRAFT_169047 [Exserohilum turcica Et28A]